MRMDKDKIHEKQKFHNDLSEIKNKREKQMMHKENDVFLYVCVISMWYEHIVCVYVCVCMFTQVCVYFGAYACIGYRLKSDVFFDNSPCYLLKYCLLLNPGIASSNNLTGYLVLYLFFKC